MSRDYMYIYSLPVVIATIVTIVTNEGPRGFAINLCFALGGTLMGVLTRQPRR